MSPIFTGDDNLYINLYNVHKKKKSIHSVLAMRYLAKTTFHLIFTRNGNKTTKYYRYPTGREHYPPDRLIVRLNIKNHLEKKKKNVPEQTA